jgi:hypothetical protein
MKMIQGVGTKGIRTLTTIKSGESSLLVIILDFIIMHIPMCVLKNIFLFHDII